MKYTAEAPKLPKLPFIVGDLVLIATAVLIATRSASPIQPLPLLVIGLCVIFGAALLVVPFLADYARRQDAELTERQNQIAALARTTADSAEQLSIAVSGLNTISDSSKRTFDAAEKLPTKLKERLDELTERFAGSSIASENALKEDIAQLHEAAEKIVRALAKIDATAKAKSDVLANAESQLTAALARASAQIDTWVNDAVTRAVRSAETAAVPVAGSAPAAVAGVSGEAVSASATVPDTKPAHDASSTEAKPRPTPKHKVRNAPVADTGEGASAPAASHSQAHVAPIEAVVADRPVNAPAPASVAAAAPEITPPVEQSEPTIEPVASAERAEVAQVSSPVVEAAAPKAPRARKPRHDDDGFDLGLTPEPSEPSESALTSDGFTRLIATAYIGIGNKLFIRGEGPGLSWDKGVPLQFVSIGKWRWETGDATGPITARLYKNDQIECVGLGTLTLEPGRQHEVNAGF